MFGVFLICIFFMGCDERRLPVFKINSNQPINFDKKVECNLELILKNQKELLDGQIKARGGYSAKFSKRSYYIELENRVSLLQLPREDDWILNASYIDKTFIRHKISYDLFRMMDKNNLSPQSKYINLTVNEKKKGIYILMEKVTGRFVGLDKSDLRAGLWKDPPLFRKDIVFRGQNMWEQKFPKYKESNLDSQLEALYDIISYSTDKDFIRVIHQEFNLANLIDWHLLLLLSNNSDGILKNFYLYKKSINHPYQIAIWDYDHSFGRDGDNEYNMLDRVLNIERSVLFSRLLEIPEIDYKVKLKTRYNELRESEIFSEKNLFRMITDNVEILQTSVVGNERLWPYNSKNYFDDNSFDEEIELMKEYISKRLIQLDEQFY